MCGIAGVLDARWSGDAAALAKAADAMAATLAHRGPDGAGSWADPAAGIGLAQRRLAIVDRSDAGAQPMCSADGRWVLVYNGECYNSADLSAVLARRGLRFRGHCDTEVVLEAVAAWGFEAALHRLDAMFALAAWDRRDRVLHLARDRLGEKPLYYSAAAGVLLFGSELRAVAAHPACDRTVDRDALADLLRLNYVPAPRSIYAGVRKLAAGTRLAVPAGGPGWPPPQRWWDFPAVAAAAVARRPAAGDGALDELHDRLRQAVARRLVADVTVGTFLSGGVDSSLVTALAAEAHAAPVRTFTVGFGGEGADEAAPAAAVARHLGTEHTAVELTAADALAAVPEVGRCWDEPFADPSQLPTYLLAREARRHLVVALTGDGGDEAFGGYNRYTLGAVAGRWLLPLPEPLRRAGAGTLRRVRPASWDRLGAAAAVLARRPAIPDLGTKAHKLAGLLGAASPSELYAALVSSWPDSASVVAGAGAGAHPPEPMAGIDDPADAMMAWDTVTTLPDEMLAKVDRATMAVGLEARPPLLDHRVVEAAWALPPQLRVAGGTGKQALRLLLSRYLPVGLWQRPKVGFDPPLAAWLRGPLREWAGDLLSPARLRSEGYLRPEPVAAAWAEHQAGAANRDYALWSVLVWESWLDAQAAPR
jgi:asparagine synthase (glutamine-hydrolysing)